MIPNKTTYPEKYDTDYELKTVEDSLVSKIISEIIPYDEENSKTFNWEEGQGIIFLEDTSSWPNSGFVSVYLKEHWGKALERSTLFHYASKDDNSLLQVTILPGQEIKYFPIDSLAVQNVVAQNHNYSKDSIIALEKYLGNRGTEDKTTIEWFADFYTKNIKIPKAWMNIYPSNLLTTRSFEERTTREVRVFIDDYIVFEDKTTRIQPGFSFNEDPNVQWVFQFGDGTKVSITLDLDTEEYVFDIFTFDEQNIIKKTVERRKSWDGKIYHKYLKQGVYNVFLTVYNSNGRDELKLYDIIHIMDEAPHSLNLVVSSTSGSRGLFATEPGTSILTALSSNNRVRSLAIEDIVNISSFLENGNLEIEKWIWDLGPNVDSDSLLNKPSLNISFSVGGIYDVGLRVVSKTGSYIGAFLREAIDIIEKPSVWLGYNTRTSGEFYMNEYSIQGNSWKSNGLILNLNYNYNFSGSDPTNAFNFINDKGFHSKVGTNDSYIFWSNSNIQANVASYNSLANSSTNLNSLSRIYNWFTFYIPTYSTDKVFILGGLLDLNIPEEINQEISYFDISTNSFQNIEVGIVSVQIPDPDCDEEEECPLISKTYASPFAETQDFLIKNPRKKLAKWKTTSFGSLGYMLRNSENDLLEDFFSFDPLEVVFRKIQTTVPFSKRELGFDALVNGIYVVSNAGDLFRYNVDANVWTGTTIASTRNYSDLFYGSKISSRDPNAKLVTGTESRSSNSSNTNLYFSYNYDLDAFGKFNAIDLTFSKLSSRPFYPNESGIIDQWDATVN